MDAGVLWIAGKSAVFSCLLSFICMCFECISKYLLYLQCEYMQWILIIWEYHEFWEDGKLCDLGLSQGY